MRFLFEFSSREKRGRKKIMKFLFMICLVAVRSVFTENISAHPAGECKNEAGERIYEAEKILENLGYWIIAVDCKGDASTNQALLAFQKVEGFKRTGILTNQLVIALRHASRPVPKYAGGAHLEVDVTRQVLFLVNENNLVERILPVSTGNEKRYFDEGRWQTAHTPRGVFKIERKINGVRHAPLGDLYNPNYFYRGVAIHGSLSVPPYPASHGCVRIPRFADQEFSALVKLEMIVYVYD